MEGICKQGISTNKMYRRYGMRGKITLLQTAHRLLEVELARYRGGGAHLRCTPSERLQMNVHAHWGKQNAQSGRAEHIRGRLPGGPRGGGAALSSALSHVPGGLVLWRLNVLAGEARAVPTELLPVPPSQVGERLGLVHLVAGPQRQQELVLRA